MKKRAKGKSALAAAGTKSAKVKYTDAQRDIFHGLMDKLARKELKKNDAWSKAKDKGYKGSVNTFYLAMYKRKNSSTAKLKTKIKSSPAAKPAKKIVPAKAKRKYVRKAAAAQVEAPVADFGSKLAAYIDARVSSIVEASLRDALGKIIR